MEDAALRLTATVTPPAFSTLLLEICANSTAGGPSSSVMVSVWGFVAPTFALDALLSVKMTVSSPSSAVSLTMTTEMFFDVSPGLKVTVPSSRLWSLSALGGSTAVPVTAKSTVTVCELALASVTSTSAVPPFSAMVLVPWANSTSGVPSLSLMVTVCELWEPMVPLLAFDSPKVMVSLVSDKESSVSKIEIVPEVCPSVIVTDPSNTYEPNLFFTILGGTVIFIACVMLAVWF